jgi:hypothetical protein
VKVLSYTQRESRILSGTDSAAIWMGLSVPTKIELRHGHLFA